MNIFQKTTLFFAFLFTVCLTQDLNAQNVETPELVNHEIGLRFSGFDDFNLMYKKALPNGTIRRHRFLFGSFNYGSSASSFDLRGGYAFGWEKRKKMNSDFSFVHGPEISLVVDYQNTKLGNDERIKTTNLLPSFGYVIGFQYDISPSFYISLEVIPAISSSIRLRGEEDVLYTLAANLNSNATALTLMYRFAK